MRRRRGAARLAMTCKRETCAEHPAPFCIRPAPSEAAPRGNSGARLFHLAAFAFYGPASRRPAKSAAAEIPCRLLLPLAAAARNPTIATGQAKMSDDRDDQPGNGTQVQRVGALFFSPERGQSSFRQDEKKMGGAKTAAAGGRPRQFSRSAAAPLAGRREAGPGRANAARWIALRKERLANRRRKRIHPSASRCSAPPLAGEAWGDGLPRQ